MLDWIVEKLLSFLSYVVAALPRSPFTAFIEDVSHFPFLGYANWFLPIGKMLEAGAAWLAAIALFYLYSMIARWIKLIQ